MDCAKSQQRGLFNRVWKLVAFARTASFAASRPLGSKLGAVRCYCVEQALRKWEPDHSLPNLVQAGRLTIHPGNRAL
jgi:hypothetical protein